MGWFFIFISIIMVILLAGVQVSRVYPIWSKLPEDPYAGASMEQFISLVERGKVTVDVAGIYETHSAMIYKNGERYLLAEKFPVDIEVIEGDVLEIWVFEENPGASLIVKDTGENFRLKYSRTSLPLEKGLHRIGKVIYATDRKK
ncbi:MAG: hypothetical protein GXY12_00550 [Clostridiaceae bacterium]|jgi:hypothetical protein|nr:hypothetical protein [Clostridiaceae bacterium]